MDSESPAAVVAAWAAGHDGGIFSSLAGLSDTWRLAAITAEPGVSAVPAAPPIPRFGFTGTPNPVRARAMLRFALPESRPVRLIVFDTAGRRVRVVLDGDVLAAGQHEVPLDAGSLGMGVYFARLECGNEAATHKFTVIR